MIQWWPQCFCNIFWRVWFNHVIWYVDLVLKYDYCLYLFVYYRLNAWTWLAEEPSRTRTHLLQVCLIRLELNSAGPSLDSAVLRCAIIQHLSDALLHIYLQVRVMGNNSAQVSRIAPQHNKGLFAIWSTACRSWARSRCSITDPLQSAVHPGRMTGRTEPERSDREAQHAPIKHTSRFLFREGRGPARERL